VSASDHPAADAPGSNGSASGAPAGSIAASLPVGSELAQEHPEALVGAAFVVGFLAGRVLKRITAAD
jgi:hypothetical protein